MRRVRQRVVGGSPHTRTWVSNETRIVLVSLMGGRQVASFLKSLEISWEIYTSLRNGTKLETGSDIVP